MIKFFERNDRDFSSNGLFAVAPISCIETKKKSLNGWTIEVDLDISYMNKVEQNMLAVIKSKSKVNPQAFRVNNIEYYRDYLTFTAEHVMFDARNYFLLDSRPTGQPAGGALSVVNSATDEASPFTVSSDIETLSTAYFVRKNLLEAWTTIEERWGGAFDADNWIIKLASKIGNDDGEIVQYGKNLRDIKVYEDWSSVVTKLCPVGKDELMLPERYLFGDVTYDFPYTKTITFASDLDDTATQAELITELRLKAQIYLSKYQYPLMSYEVKADVNQNLQIGDTVHIKHPLVTIDTEVLEYVYNVNIDVVTSITFGNYSRDVKAKFDAIKDSISKVAENLTSTQKIINHQTDLINTLNKTGYVYQDENEILILDSLPKETATNVWRIGLGGMGFSTNGYEGPFKQAWTQDGWFNTEFIQVGSLNGNVITANSIKANALTIEAVEYLKGQIQGSDNIIPNFVGQYAPNQYWNYITVPPPWGIPWDVAYWMSNNDPIMTIIDTDSIAGTGFRIWRSGKIISNIIPCNGGADYSLTTKIKASGVLVFKVREYSSVGVYPDDYNSHTKETTLLTTTIDTANWQSPSATMHTRADTAALCLIIDSQVDVLNSQYAIISDNMFNYGSPREWAISVTDLQADIAYARTTAEVTSEGLTLLSEKVTTNANGLAQAKLDITATANGLTSKVSTVDYTGEKVASMINQSASTVKIKASHIQLEGTVTANNNFKVNTDGTAEMVNAKVSGEVTAESGEIAGFVIDYRGFKRGDLSIYDSYIGLGQYGILKSIMGIDFRTPVITIGDNTDETATREIYWGAKGTDYTPFVTKWGSNTIVRANNLIPSGVGSREIGSNGNRYDYIFLVNAPNVSSDSRLKSDIQDIQKALEFVMSLEPKQFVKQNGQQDFGFIAQQVDEVNQDLGIENASYHFKTENPEDMQSLSYESLIAPLYAVIQQQQRQIEDLSQKVEALMKGKENEK